MSLLSIQHTNRRRILLKSFDFRVFAGFWWSNTAAEKYIDGLLVILVDFGVWKAPVKVINTLPVVHSCWCVWLRGFNIRHSMQTRNIADKRVLSIGCRNLASILFRHQHQTLILHRETGQRSKGRESTPVRSSYLWRDLFTFCRAPTAASSWSLKRWKLAGSSINDLPQPE